MTEVELIEQTALRVGMRSLLNHGAASCVFTEGIEGVSQDHLIAFTREVALHCAVQLGMPEPAPAPSGATPAEDGYAKAFYEIASVLGIGARDDTPENVFRNEMLPMIVALASREASPAPLTDEQIDILLLALDNFARSVEIDGHEFGLPLHSFRGHLRSEVRGALASPQVAPDPIDMVLHCPTCHMQHIDEPDERTPGWKNEPHRSHLCHGCGHIWRPADAPTNGVEAVSTAGKADSPIAAPVQVAPAATAPDDHENSYEALPEQLRERALWLEKRGRIKDCELMRDAAMVISETRRGLQSFVAQRRSNAA